MDDRDAEVLAVGYTVDGDGFAVHTNFARVRLEHAGKHLDERAFSGAVLAHNRMDFAGPNREVDAIDSADLKKGFAEVDRL